MPEPQITNPGGVWGAPVQTGNRTTPLVNGSTSTVAQYSVVVMSTVSAASPTLQQFFPTVVAAHTGVLGVLLEDTPAGTEGPVAVEGFSLVAVSSSAIPAVGDTLATSTVLSQSTAANTPVLGLVRSSTAATPIGSIIGVSASTALDAFVSSSTGVGVFVPAYIHKA